MRGPVLSWPVIQSRVCSHPLKPSCHQPKPPEASEGASMYTNSMSAGSAPASDAICRRKVAPVP